MESRLSKFSVSELIDLAAGISALIKTAFPEAGESGPQFSGYEMSVIPSVLNFQLEIFLELPLHLPEEYITNYKEGRFPLNSTFPQDEEQSSQQKT
jgi:hypothetical protein